MKRKRFLFFFNVKSGNDHFTNCKVLVKWLVKRFTFTLQTVKLLFCGFDRFWKSKWTGENGHFSNSEWASASRFIYYLKIDNLSIFAHFARFSRIYYLKSDHWPLSTLDLREKATFCAVFAHLLFENRPLVAFQIGNCAVPRCWSIFSMSSPEKSGKFMKNMKKRQESRPRRLIFLKLLKNRPTWSRFLLFPQKREQNPSLSTSSKISLWLS